MLKPLLTAAFIALTSGMALATPFADVSDALDRGDYTRAFELMRPLAEQGDALSQAGLGAAYYAGQGVAKDHKKAEKWFRLAARQGDALSQTLLSKMARAKKPASQPVHETRQAEPRLESSAVRRYRKAAETGHATAQNTLGTLLAYGKGVAEDRVHAYMWFYLAAEQGFALARRNQVRAARLMTSTEIAQAENLAEERLARTLAAAADQSEDPDAS